VDSGSAAETHPEQVHSIFRKARFVLGICKTYRLARAMKPGRQIAALDRLSRILTRK
jgi:hypothetical protein